MYTTKGGEKMGSILFWLCVAIGAFLLDVLSSSFFFVLFSIGAIIAAISSIFNVPFMIQVIIFAIISIIAFIVGYPWLKKNYKNLHKKTPLMEETYIGKMIEADKDIKDKAQIKVNGEYWTVINEGDLIHQGEKFIIIGIEGIKLKIKKA